MSIIAVNNLCRAIERDSALRQALLEDPRGQLEKYPDALTEVERSALLSGDVKTLYEMGANDYLLRSLAHYKIFGLNMETYSEQMRNCTPFAVTNILVR